jgi:hypothetical protein
MKLTKSQRHTAYILMLAQLKKSTFLCSIFCDLTGIDLDEDSRFSNFKNILPELWLKKDPGESELSGILWKNKARRTKALKQCIEETY